METIGFHRFDLDSIFPINYLYVSSLAYALRLFSRLEIHALVGLIRDWFVRYNDYVVHNYLQWGNIQGKILSNVTLIKC